MPVPPGMLLDGSNVLPSWAILLATGDRVGPAFKLVDAQMPFDASLGDAVTLADPHGARTGDGAQDAILPLGSVLKSWNPYSYVLNNPLAYVDPGGFQEAPPEDGARPPPPPGAELSWEVHDLAPLGLDLRAVPLPKHEARPDTDTNTVAAETGGAMPPIDVSTTGSASGHVPQPVTTAPIDCWSQNPYVQVEGGFIAGLSLGAVPFAGVGHGLLDATGVLPHGTPEARMGLAIGQIVGGIALTIGGLTGEVFGGITSATGIGAAVGVPAIVVSTGLVVGGVGNIAAGIQGLSQALMSQGSGTTGPQSTTAAAGGAAKVGGRTPINSQWAGKVHPSGVRYTKQGFPDFSPFSKARVEIDGLTGNHARDAAMANKAVGLKATPEGYVWHHVEDARTMLLVPRDIHQAARHTGGAAIIRGER